MTKKEKKSIVQSWQIFYESKGIDSNLSTKYLDYVSLLLDHNVPPIFDFNHLSLLLGYETSSLASIVNCPNSFYRTFSIPKRSGGQRTITAPYPSLKHIQRWINSNILNRLSVHGCVHGFVPKRSIITNAKIHVNQKFLLKVDLENFFISIPINWVLNFFRQLGYTKSVSFYLASLCCYNGALAQGAPTSPNLSNLLCISLDRRLYRLAKHFGLNYTRYADDIAFSGDFISIKFFDYVNAIIQDFGLSVNKKKVRLYSPNGNKILTGVCLSSSEPKLPRDAKRRLKKELHYIERYGLAGHISHNKIRQYNYCESLLGKVNFWLLVEPNNEYAKHMKMVLTQSFKGDS